ncbi:putative RING-H2 finger protein ATL21C [Phalaenopsis equestris]|uniref:putative RING-H2 finger protein ATL21C n=1 Tax=Phalaenopsis equestris TaxID=78828 RepID=UPI0009E38198|nr:putative RING-H2 finger protein ATL21C [Phalaenopsis equestris]
MIPNSSLLKNNGSFFSNSSSHLMDREQRNSRSSVFLLLISISLTAALVTIYHCISRIYRQRQGRDMSPEFTATAVATEADMSLSIDLSTAQLIAPAQSFKKLKLVGGETAVAAGGGGGGGGGEETTCPVCLSEFEEGEAVRYLPECGHCFHVGCIDMWFRWHSTCPVCRSQTLLAST